MCGCLCWVSFSSHPPHLSNAPPLQILPIYVYELLRVTRFVGLHSPWTGPDTYRHCICTIAIVMLRMCTCVPRARFLYIITRSIFQHVSLTFGNIHPCNAARMKPEPCTWGCEYAPSSRSDAGKFFLHWSLPGVYAQLGVEAFGHICGVCWGREVSFVIVRLWRHPWGEGKYECEILFVIRTRSGSLSVIRGTCGYVCVWYVVVLYVVVWCTRVLCENMYAGLCDMW